MSNRTRIYDYLKENKYIALATADEQGRPEVATIQYVMDGDELLISTYTHYRKYQNLVQNPYVACVLTTAHDRTLQIEGGIRQLDGDEAGDARQKLLEAEPGFRDYFTDDTRFFRITPTWMRLRDYTEKPVKEITMRGDTYAD